MFLCCPVNTLESHGNHCSSCEATGDVEVLLTELNHFGWDWGVRITPQVDLVQSLLDNHTNTSPIDLDDP